MDVGKGMIVKENAEELQNPILHFPTVIYLRIVSNVNKHRKDVL